jgi:hypothetical protein
MSVNSKHERGAMGLAEGGREMLLKTGTKIVLRGSPAIGAFPAVVPETARIARWTTRQGSRESVPGYHRVRFADGSSLLIHESRFDVVSD